MNHDSKSNPFEPLALQLSDGLGAAGDCDPSLRAAKTREPVSTSPYNALDYLKTPEDLEGYVQLAIKEAVDEAAASTQKAMLNIVMSAPLQMEHYTDRPDGWGEIEMALKAMAFDIATKMRAHFEAHNVELTGGPQ